MPDHNSKAEESAAEEVKHLGQGGEKDAAAVCAALAQVYATLAVAAAIEAAAISRGRPKIPGSVVVPPVMPEPGPPGVDPLLGF